MYPDCWKYGVALYADPSNYLICGLIPNHHNTGIGITVMKIRFV